MKQTKQPRRQIKWMLESLLDKRRINATQLAQDLQAIGVVISISQAGRLAYTRPQKISVDPLIAMVKYFDCDIGDLLNVPGGNRVPWKNMEKGQIYTLVLQGEEHHLYWKARARFDESGLSYELLAEKLASLEVVYERTTLYRLINKMPKRIDLLFLEGAMTVFNCNLTDIVDVE